jgi:flagellar hook-length control protein FliK
LLRGLGNKRGPVDLLDIASLVSLPTAPQPVGAGMPANSDSPFGALLGDTTGEAQQAAPDAAVTALLLNPPLLAGLAPQTPVQAGQPSPAETPQTEQAALPQTDAAAASAAETAPAQAPLSAAANPAPADEDNTPAANPGTAAAPAQPAGENSASAYIEVAQQDSPAPAANPVADTTVPAEAQPEPAGAAAPQPPPLPPQTALVPPDLPDAATPGAQPAQTATPQPGATAAQTAAPAKDVAQSEELTDAQGAAAAVIPPPVPQAKTPSDAPRTAAKTDPAQKEDEQPVRKTAAATPQTLLATFLLAQMQPQAANDAAPAAPQLSGVAAADKTDGSKPETKQTDASASDPGQNAAPQAATPDGKTDGGSPLPQADAPQSGEAPAPQIPANQTAAQTAAQASAQASAQAAVPPPPHHVQQAASPAAVAAVAPGAAAGLAVSPKHDDADTGLDKLGLVIAAKSVDGVRHFDIRLDPPELGRVQVSLAMDDAGRARADLVVDKPQTLELLQRDAGNLNRALTDAGLDLSNNGLNFSLREQYRQNDGDADQGRSRELSVKAVVQTDASQTHAAFGSYAPNSVRLDIRV